MYRLAMFLRIGRRGACLLLLGGIVLLLGLALLARPPQNTDSYILLAKIMPLKVWGYVDVGIGLSMFLGSGYKRIETYAFGMSSCLFSLWGTGFLAQLFVGHTIADINTGGLVRSALIYYGIAVLLQIISGWPEVPSNIERRK